MKLDPLNLLTNSNLELNKKFYFISGNELSLIEEIKTVIIKKYQLSEDVLLERIDYIDDFVDVEGLFNNKNLIIIKNHKGINEYALDKFRKTSNIFIFVHENSQKIKKLKQMFIKDKDCYLIDCYELDRNSKTKILNGFLEKTGININKDIYWFLIEKLDNKYVFFKNNLNKILELNQREITIDNIRKILTIDDSGKGKLFFTLLRANRDIVSAYKDKVLTPLDVNEFYYFCKFYCQLIIDCKNEEEFNKKIPLYLFKEKNFLVDIYRRYNLKKKKILLKLLSSTEKVLRKESNLSVIWGLRFFLNIKKITIS